MASRGRRRVLDVTHIPRRPGPEAGGHGDLREFRASIPGTAMKIFPAVHYRWAGCGPTMKRRDTNLVPAAPAAGTTSRASMRPASATTRTRANGWSQLAPLLHLRRCRGPAMTSKPGIR